MNHFHWRSTDPRLAAGDQKIPIIVIYPRSDAPGVFHTAFAHAGKGLIVTLTPGQVPMGDLGVRPIEIASVSVDTSWPAGWLWCHAPAEEK